MSPKYFPQIDVLRFFAVVLVIFSHWLPDHWINHLHIGRLGVDLFFVISGFLITRILFQLRDRPGALGQKLKVFFARRVLRIFPIYYFVVLLAYFFNKGVFADALFWNLCYGSNFYILKLDSWPGIMSHFWTLSVEEHFYLLWPFLILLPARKWLSSAIFSILLVGVLSRSFFFYWDFSYLYTHVFTFSCFDTLAFGGLLAFIYCYRRESLFVELTERRYLVLLPLAGLLYCLYSIHFHENYYSIWNSVYFRFFSGLFFFFILGFSITSTLSFFYQKQFIFLGKLSYSMYLFHNFVPGFLMGLPYPVNIYGRIVLYFIVLVLISYLSWKLIELPFNRLKHRFPYEFSLRQQSK